MINFSDRISEYPQRYTMTNNADGSVTLTPKPGTVTNSGTVLNRVNMMAVQGFGDCNTVFNSDGSISETFQDGSVKKTVFNSDGSITETFRSGTQTMTKTTTFNSDGSITEAV